MKKDSCQLVDAENYLAMITGYIKPAVTQSDEHTETYLAMNISRIKHMGANKKAWFFQGVNLHVI